MATIDVNGTTVHYERIGTGPAILFVHGLCGHAGAWTEQAERLADRHTCVRYDRRGHTGSARGDAIITDALHADDAAALIEALDLAPCLIVGSSSGAAIAVDVMLRYGHLLRGAVLSEPPLFSLDPDAGRETMDELGPLVEEAVASGRPGAFVDAFYPAMCPGLWAIIGEAAKDGYRANAEIGLVDLMSPSLAVTPEDLATVTTPALVVAGDRSRRVFRSIARRLAGALADARLVEIEGSGHVTYAEQPDAFTHAVSAFAAELDRRAAPAGP